MYMTQKEYISLVDRSKQLSYEYYVLAKPTVSDAQFDALVSEIEQAESEHPEWTLADSPTQMVGSDVDAKSGRRLIRHRSRMLSCQKAQTQEAVTKWMQTTEKKLKKVGNVHYVLEWKLDGISCSLVYQDGMLVSAATRGEKGIIGQDLLAHVKRMPSVPQSIVMDGRVEVRGEIVCPKANLAALGYKDCRTAAAALCNQVTPSRDMSRLEFVAWQLDTTDGIGTETAAMVVAGEQGFKTSGYTGCRSGDVLTRLDEFAVRREDLEWPTDGVVIKIDCRPQAVSLGFTEHHPKGSIAYKFSAQKTVTRVTRIEISIGEKGGRTPVAYLVPVMIMGREVKQVSLYSERKMTELGVTEGCLVEVGLSNDVTPKVYRVIEQAAEYTEPEKSETAEPAIDDESTLPKIDGGDDAANDFDNDLESVSTVIDAMAEDAAEASAAESAACETEHSVLTDDTDGDSTDEDKHQCDVEDVTAEASPVGASPLGVGEVQVREQEATEMIASAAVGIAVAPAPEPFVSPEPAPAVPRSQREILAERRHQRRLERERMQRSYEERMEREAREAEQAAREEEHRKIFAAVGAVAVTAVMIYFFGLLGPAVFGLLCGGLLKG